MTTSLLPLEERLNALFEADPNQFPIRTTDYWARYTGLLGGLREQIYPNVNAGLACLSKSPGMYTDHGGTHFDEVVRYAGLLLGLPAQTLSLRPYEVYLLLCAIRLHDAGNIDGREQHEKRVAKILEEVGGTIRLDTPESDLISRIAQAHGGKTFRGDKDTISELPDETPLGPILCRPRQVAALVRFADEVCEHRARASGHHVRAGTLPDENKLFHYYALSIVGAVPDRRMQTLKLHFDIDIQYTKEKYSTPPDEGGARKEKFLIDEILDRIVKLDTERVYCNQFLDPNLRTNQLEVTIRLIGNRVIQGALITGTLENFEFKVPPQTGYPAAVIDWKDRQSGLTGESIAVRAKGEWQ